MFLKLFLVGTSNVSAIFNKTIESTRAALHMVGVSKSGCLCQQNNASRHATSLLQNGFYEYYVYRCHPAQLVPVVWLVPPGTAAEAIGMDSGGQVCFSGSVQFINRWAPMNLTLIPQADLTPLIPLMVVVLFGFLNINFTHFLTWC